MAALPPLLEHHFRFPRHAGDPSGADALGRGRNAACGDELELGLWVARGLVREVRFRARACSATLATASLVGERLAGATVEEARALDLGQLLAAAGGLPRGRGHARAVVQRALEQALSGLGTRYP